MTTWVDVHLLSPKAERRGAKSCSLRLVEINLVNETYEIYISRPKIMHLIGRVFFY